MLIAADDQDGFAVCRRLKTGRDILACGAGAIMDKPIAVDEFRSRVMALLSARR